MGALTTVLGDGDAAAILKAGMKCAEVRQHDMQGVPHLLLPEGMRAESFEKLLPAPTRICCAHAFEEPDSFCAYVADFKDGNTRLYGDPDAFSFTAVLDDNMKSDPRWREHRATLQLKKSPEWLDWMDAFENPYDQQALFEFLTDHVDQIAEPDATDLLSGISNVHIDSNWKCKSAQREGGDIHFAYEKENTAKTATGKIPSRLTLFIAPFRSWEQVSMTVYLSYRLNGEKLAFTMRGHNVEGLLGKVFNDVRNHVQEKVGMPALV